MLSLPPFLRLQGVVQHYAWGQQYDASIFSRFGGTRSFDRSKPFAELWFGAHPSGPAHVEFEGSSRFLPEILAEHSLELLGKDIHKKYEGTLPFLFKILSIRSALSIQAHPDSDLAKRLHGRDPVLYPDPRHKPEVAVAITPVSLLSGFRRSEEIAKNLQTTPELAAAIGATLTREVLAAASQPSIWPRVLREAFQVLLQNSDTEIERQCSALFQRLDAQRTRTPEDEWILKLRQNFPRGDVGLFSFYLLNLITLAPGQALFVGANIPHAYLQGELVECMANSDNVVRAGLTSKPKDISTLVSMIDVESTSPTIIEPNTIGAWEVFSLPVQEFALCRVQGNTRIADCETGNRPELLFCLQGRARLQAHGSSVPLEAGSCVLISAKTTAYDLTLDQAVVFRVLIPAR